MNEQTAPQPDLYSQSVIQVLAAQRNAATDQLVHVNGLLAVANARIADLEVQLAAKKTEAQA